MDDTEQSAVRRGAQKALDRVWESIPWAVGALLGAAINGWVAVRDLNHAVSALESAVGGCASQDDCERRGAEISGLRVTLGELVARVVDLERYEQRHDATDEIYRRRSDETSERLRQLEMMR